MKVKCKSLSLVGEFDGQKVEVGTKFELDEEEAFALQDRGRLEILLDKPVKKTAKKEDAST